MIEGEPPVPCQLSPDLDCYSFCKSRREIHEAFEDTAIEQGLGYHELIAHLRQDTRRMNIIRAHGSYILQLEERLRDCGRYPEIQPLKV